MKSAKFKTVFAMLFLMSSLALSFANAGEAPQGTPKPSEESTIQITTAGAQGETDPSLGEAARKAGAGSDPTNSEGKDTGTSSLSIWIALFALTVFGSVIYAVKSKRKS